MSHGTAGQVTQNGVAAGIGNSPIDQPGTVAIVHDYLTQKGGAERVVLAMHRAFPAAPIYTSLYEPDLTFPEFRDIDVRPSYLNRSQFLRRHHRLALPLLAQCLLQRSRSTRRLCSAARVVGPTASTPRAQSSSTATARPAGSTREPSTFARARTPRLRGHTFILTGRDPYLVRFRNSLRAVSPMLRRWDRRAAASASAYYTNSSAVSDEISSLYGIQPLVIPPPPLCADDGPWEKPNTLAKDGFFLVVSRLLPYKNLDRNLRRVRGTP